MTAADRTPLRPGSSVAAILLLEDGRYLMQQRDDKPGIFFPGMWGLFGGNLEPGESERDGLLRELREELALEAAPDAVRFFTRVDYDMGFAGLGMLNRIVFELSLPVDALADLRLGEGRAFHAFAPFDLLAEPSLAPLDEFVLWLHVNQGRLIGQGS